MKVSRNGLRGDVLEADARNTLRLVLAAVLALAATV
jgi:hypothetical protein